MINKKNQSGVLLNPVNTSRKRAFESFSNSPQPITSLTSEINISELINLSRETGYKLNSMICFLIQKASEKIEEFYLEIRNEVKNKREKRELYRNDKLCVGIVVKGDDDQIYHCFIPQCDNFKEFSALYNERVEKCRTAHVDLICEGASKIGTSVLTKIKINAMHNQYSGVFNNPFLVWGKYDESGILPIAFNFHHLQMDGQHVEEFFINLQEEIDKFDIPK